MIPRVAGAIDPARLSIRNRKCYIHRSRKYYIHTIHYDDIPLWRTVEPLGDLDIFLYDPASVNGFCAPSEREPYSLFCRDKLGDLYTYGAWATLDEAMAWLKKPEALY